LPVDESDSFDSHGLRSAPADATWIEFPGAHPAARAEQDELNVDEYLAGSGSP